MLISQKMRVNNMKVRAHGWVQNPSSFSNLKKVVSIFESTNQHYSRLEKIIKDQIFFDSDREKLLKKVQAKETVFTYDELVGKTKNSEGKNTSNRKDQVADSLIKISILPQNSKTKGKKYTDTWTSDGFLRWAVCLDFVSVERESDIYRITELGRNFIKTTDGSVEEKEALRQAFLAYPPATSVLNTLENCGKFVNKFYIGERLGFTGEKGFTSYGSETMTEWLLNAENKAEFNAIKSDREGTSDKYARMICTWLEKVGFIEKRKVFIDSEFGKTSFPEYRITPKGSHALRASQGSSKHKLIKKHVMWEFLATKVQNVNYVRTRRAYILKSLKTTKSFAKLTNYLKSKGFSDDPLVFKNDIEGLKQFGIRIEINDKQVNLIDDFSEFSIPNLPITKEIKEDFLEEIKIKLYKKTSLPKKFYELVDIAYDGSRNRDFEIYTSDLMRDVYKFSTSLLGGSRKPDILSYNDKHGYIVDTKAYSKGYRKNIQQEDEMVRYIEDNQYRDYVRNNTKWWENFNDTNNSKEYFFLWVSSEFIGDFNKQLTDTARRTNINGAALNVIQLLLGADLIRRGELTNDTLSNLMTNEEIKFIKL